MNDLVLQQQHRVLSPSPWISAQYHRRLGTQKLLRDEYNARKDSYQFDETTDSTKADNLPSEVRAMLVNMIKNYGTIEENFAVQAKQDRYEGLSEEDVAQLVENAIEAVEKFDRENNIGDRKLQNKKTVNDRLTEFFKYGGRHGVSFNVYIEETLRILFFFYYRYVS
jgi:cation transport regulator ChaB